MKSATQVRIFIPAHPQPSQWSNYAFSNLAFIFGMVMHKDDINESLVVKQASKARRNSFASANPLSLGSGAGGPRSGSLQTPLGWLTDRLAGVATR